MRDINLSLISNTKTLVDVVRTIEKSSSGIALVINEGNKLVGTITDGDIRRALLKGANLNSPIIDHMNKNFKYISTNQKKSEAFELINRFGIRQVPVLDNSRKVTDIIIKDEIFKSKRITNPVLLMAGGKGKRLYPFTKSCPKPMLNINEKPILETQLEIFINEGFKDFFISVNYLKEQIIDYFGDGSEWGVNINYLIEKKPLGTAGCLKLLPKNIKESFIVINGDILTKLSFKKLIEFHEKNSSKITICAKQYQMQLEYGVIETQNYELKGFKEKPIINNLINAGIYVIHPNVISLIKETDFKDMPSLFLEAKLKKMKVNVLPIHEYWIDIGTLSAYNIARKDWD